MRQLLAHKLLAAAELLLYAGIKDNLLKKYPEHAKEIEQFAENGPSKYLQWQMKMLARNNSVADIQKATELFDKFGRNLDKRDINQWDMKELVPALEVLVEKQQARKTKVKKRYKLDKSPEADVVFEDDHFKVLHVKNKEAACHFGLGTKWCISENDSHYFEEYSRENTVFFFVFSKDLPEDDSFAKLAVSYKRNADNRVTVTDWWNAKDKKLNPGSFVKARWEDLGEETMDVYEGIIELTRELAESYPHTKQGAPMARIKQGKGSTDDLYVVLTQMQEEGKAAEQWTVLNELAKVESLPKIAMDIKSRTKTEEHLLATVGMLYNHNFKSNKQDWSKFSLDTGEEEAA